MQKMYTQTPLANVETELIPAVEAGNIATVVTTIISTVTSAKVELFLYNGSTKLHTIVLNPPDNESVFIDSKIFLPVVPGSMHVCSEAVPFLSICLQKHCYRTM